MNKDIKITEIIDRLNAFDTPSITNVVSTYPEKESCLGLYDPWEASWYTDQSLKCIYPELGARCGYVVTCVYGRPGTGFHRLSFSDVLRAIDRSPKPVVLAIKQDLEPEIKEKSGLSGGNMTTAMKAAGVVGVLSDGPSRDIEEIRPMEIQYMLTGVTAGHGDYEIKAVNVPVNICGMDLSPGEIVHMDANGAVKFPGEYLEEVLDRVERLQEEETQMQERIRNAGDVEEIIRIMTGFEGTKGEE